MFRFASLVLLCGVISTISAEPIKQRSASHSGPYGGNGGSRFSQSVNQLDGPITALNIRVNPSTVTGLQVRYGKVWSDYVGSSNGDLQTIILYPGEAIVHASGYTDVYVRQLNLITNFKRHFSYGSNAGTSFSAYPLFQRAVLSYFSGRSGHYIDAISFHWNVKPNGAAE